VQTLAFTDASLGRRRYRDMATRSNTPEQSARTPP
jgi:hypothetical protein